MRDLKVYPEIHRSESQKSIFSSPILSAVLIIELSNSVWRSIEELNERLFEAGKPQWPESVGGVLFSMP